MLALATLVVLFATVVMSSRAHIFGDAGPVVSGSVTRTALDTVFYIALVYAALMCVLILWALWPRDELRATPLPRRSLVRTMVTPLVLTALIALFWSHRIRGNGRGLPFEGGAGAPPASVQDAFGLAPALRGGQSGIDWVAVAIVLALTVTAAALVWRRIRPRPSTGAQCRAAITAELAEVVEDTLEELEAEADPRRAVIKAYARMEVVLSKRGVPRRPAEAPYEYLSRALGELMVNEGPARRLTHLFERAKFSAAEVGESMKAEAIDCLRRIRADLGGEGRAGGHAPA